MESKIIFLQNKKVKSVFLHLKTKSLTALFSTVGLE